MINRCGRLERTSESAREVLRPTPCFCAPDILGTRRNFESFRERMIYTKRKSDAVNADLTTFSNVSVVFASNVMTTLAPTWLASAIAAEKFAAKL